jgi:hypothetical protein
LAKYVLPDGKLAEVFLIADDTASGEATISVDGEAIVSATYDPEAGTTRWTSPERDGGELLDAFVGVGPQAFPCSDYGRKVVKVTKRIWNLMITATLWPAALPGSDDASCVPSGRMS